jgi:hypothetical protein
MLVSSHRHRIRLASDGDRERIARIASLDSSTPIDGPALIGEIDGIAVAVLSLDDGRVVADPFRRTAELVAGMRAQARGTGIVDHLAWWVRNRRAGRRQPRSAYAGI